MSDLDTCLERAHEYEHGLIMQALAHSSLRLENLRLRSCLAEAIARVQELEKRLERKPAGKATRAA